MDICSMPEEDYMEKICKVFFREEQKEKKIDFCRGSDLLL